MLWLASSPIFSSGEAVGSPRVPDRPSSWRFVLDGFMTPWSVRRLRFWKLRKQTRWL